MLANFCTSPTSYINKGSFIRHTDLLTQGLFIRTVIIIKYLFNHSFREKVKEGIRVNILIILTDACIFLQTL